MENNLITNFCELFRGRTDAYGTEEGGADRRSEISYRERIRDHLFGEVPMGVYPLVYLGEDDWIVHWGCVDFDEGDTASEIHAANLQMVLNELGISSWVEISRKKGMHVWTFSEKPVAAAVMREALLGATQIAQAPTKEINPKSEGFWENGEPQEFKLGNYVRLPYPNGYEVVQRRIMVDLNTKQTYTLEDFVRQAYETRNDEKSYERATALYVPERKRHNTGVVPQYVYDGTQMDTKCMSGLTFSVFKNGPLPTQDRSGTLYRLGCLMHDDNIHPEVALAFLHDADQRWGKYAERGDTSPLQRIVEKIWDL